MSIYYVLTFIFIGKFESLRFGFGTAFCGTSVPLILFIESCIFFFAQMLSVKITEKNYQVRGAFLKSMALLSLYTEK